MVAHYRHFSVITLVTILVSICGARADAQGLADDAPEKAVKLFEDAAVHYREGRFAVAAELLQEAYNLHPEPVLLYNLGRARESNGDAERAIEAYTQYLAGDNVQGQSGVEARITRLREQLDLQRELERLRSANATKETVDNVRAAAKTEQNDEGGVVVRRTTSDPGVTNPSVAIPKDEASPARAPWVVIGVGALVLVAGGTAGLLARSEVASAKGERIQAEAFSKEQRARDLGLVANISFGAGSAILLGGIIWALVERNSGSSAELANSGRGPTISLGPNSVALIGRF